MTASNQQVLLVRQPIFDREQRVIGYELLGQGEDSGLNMMLANDPESDHSSNLILSVYTTLSEQGEEKRVPGFISISEALILENSLPQLPAKQLVIQVCPTGQNTEALIERVQNLVADGYRLCLEVVHFSKTILPLLDLVQIARFDVSLLDAEGIKKRVSALRKHKVTVMATHIHSMEQLQECIDAGCRLFEGSFLSRPRIVKGKRINSNEIAILQLMQALQKPNVKPEQLQELIMRDPVLTYKLLRIVNSAAYSLVRRVDSISQSVVMLGIEQVRKWATLIAATSHQEKPEELSRSLLIRGRMCELIAEGSKYPNPSSFFMAGMMSGFHLMLDITPDDMLSQVPLGEDIVLAISKREGLMGDVISHAIAYESGDWDQLPADFDIGLYENAYRKSLSWAKDAMLAMHEDA